METISLRTLLASVLAIGIFVVVFTFVSANEDSTVERLRVISRSDWGAQAPSSPLKALKVLPPSHVIISHTVTQFCYSQHMCALNVRSIQTFHMETNNWEDIAYNFLVGGDGNVYEGRGWDVEGAHTYSYNFKSIGIALIGNFNSEKPTKAQLIAVRRLIAYGAKNGNISKDYKLLGHRQCVKTQSPGEVLYRIIKKWDHWSAIP